MSNKLVKRPVKCVAMAHLSLHVLAMLSKVHAADLSMVRLEAS